MRDDPIWHDAPPTTGEGELVVSDRQSIDPAMRAAAGALQRMSDEGRSGKVTVSMSVEVEQYPEAQPYDAGDAALRRDEQQRFALGLALALGVVGGLLAASFSFVPDLGGGLVGLVAAVWIYGRVRP